MSRGTPSEKQIAARIKPGQVLNPYGRPKKVYTAQELMDRQIRSDLKAVAKEHSPEAFRFLLATMRNEDAALQHRLSAATQIIDRGWGKPTNQTEIKVDVYEKMSDVELIKLITGRELDPDEVAEARAHLDDGKIIDHEPRATDDDSGDESNEQ